MYVDVEHHMRWIGIVTVTENTNDRQKLEKVVMARARLNFASAGKIALKRLSIVVMSTVAICLLAFVFYSSMVL